MEYVEWFIEPAYRFLSPTLYNKKPSNIVEFPITPENLSQNSEYQKNLIDEELKQPID